LRLEELEGRRLQTNCSSLVRDHELVLEVKVTHNRDVATHCSDYDGLGAKLDEDTGSMQLVGRVVQLHSVAPGRNDRIPDRLVGEKARQAA
jgi:hypothetical protein